MCGKLTVCALNAKEIRTVIDVDADSQQSIRVEVPKGGSCHVSGSRWQAVADCAARLISEQSIFWRVDGEPLGLAAI